MTLPPAAGELWARRSPLEGANNSRKYAQPRWHRVAEVDDFAIITLCHRVLHVPLETTADIPDGECACARCTKPPVAGAFLTAGT